MGLFKRYGYAWVTLGFFLVSLALHFYFGWATFRDDAAQHGATAEMGEFLNQWGRDVFENWQSEFLQLLWQVAGLAYFLYIGSPSSKENDDRMEAKLDALIRINAGEEGDRLVKQLDELFARQHGHADPFAHQEDLAQNSGKGIRHVAVRAQKSG